MADVQVSIVSTPTAFCSLSSLSLFRSLSLLLLRFLLLLLLLLLVGLFLLGLLGVIGGGFSGRAPKLGNRGGINWLDEDGGRGRRGRFYRNNFLLRLFRFGLRLLRLGIFFARVAEIKAGLALTSMDTALISIDETGREDTTAGAFGYGLLSGRVADGLLLLLLISLVLDLDVLSLGGLDGESGLGVHVGLGIGQHAADKGEH